MPTFIMLTRIDPGALDTEQAVLDLNDEVSARIADECPDVRWNANYAVLGPHDYLDVFEAPNNDVAAQVGLLVRSTGHATTEIWPATPWARFKQFVSRTPEASDDAGPSPRRVDQAGRSSFPASDPPSWTGTTATQHGH